MSKLIWSDVLGNQYADGSLADGLLRHYLTPPPAPAAPPKPLPTWEPSEEAVQMLDHWIVREWTSRKTFLRRLYAQLHRDRVAALPSPAWKDWEGRDVSGPDPGFATVRARSGEAVAIQRRHLLALADDGNGD